MPTEKIDRRIQRTRQQLEEALIALIIDKGYEATTVQDIINKANVGRTTFYAHYQNKTQLLDDCFETLDSVLGQHEKMVAKGTGDSDFILGLFQFVEQNQRLFKALFGKQGGGVTNRHAYQHLYRSIYTNLLAQMQTHLKVLSPNNEWCEPMRFEILAHYFVSAFLGVTIWWLDKDMPYTAAEVSGYFQQLTLEGFGVLHVDLSA